MQVRLLGPVDVVVDGEPRPVRGLRRKAVLAVLALQAGEVVSTDRLTDVVWGQAAPVTAVNTLQSHMSYLRTVFGDKCTILARAPGYLLDLCGDGTDVQEAERLLTEGMRSAEPAETARHLRRALSLTRPLQRRIRAAGQYQVQLRLTGPGTTRPAGRSRPWQPRAPTAEPGAHGRALGEADAPRVKERWAGTPAAGASPAAARQPNSGEPKSLSRSGPLSTLPLGLRGSGVALIAMYWGTLKSARCSSA